MQRLLEPEAIELDPETRAAVDEVCAAVSDPWGAPTGLGQRFRFALYQAAKYGSPECRQRIFAAVETAVRTDPDLWIAEGGICIPRDTVGQYQGRIVYEHGEDGQMRQVLHSDQRLMRKTVSGADTRPRNAPTGQRNRQ